MLYLFDKRKNHPDRKEMEAYLFTKVIESLDSRLIMHAHCT